MERNIDEKLDTVMTAAGERETLDGFYDTWAAEYDQDLWASGNPYFSLLSAMTARYVDDKTVPILDCGCGTGLVGQMLNLLGFTTIDGLDPSEGMLEAARAKGRYRDLWPLLLAETIDLPDDSCDVLTAAGVLTAGHAPPASLDGMLRVARPGALIVFSMSNAGFRDYGFGAKIAELTDAGAMTKIDESKPFQSYPYSDGHADLEHWVSVYRKAP